MDDHSAAGQGRRRTASRAYRLVEVDQDGQQASEIFFAPDDDAALERALGVGQGKIVELWSGSDLIRRWTDAGSPRSGIVLQ